MTRPPATNKVLLVEKALRRAEAPEPGSAIIKRYRLARLRFDGQQDGAAGRYEHLKRVYD